VANFNSTSNPEKATLALHFYPSHFHQTAAMLKQIFLLAASIHASWSYMLPHWHSMLKISRSQLLATTEKVDKASLPSPGAPVVQSLDQDNLLAKILLAVPGSVTQSAFSEACKLFNEVCRLKVIVS